MNSIIEFLNSWGDRLLVFGRPILLQSSLLMAALFALDFVLKRKVRAGFRYGIWLVVLLKLLLPPSFTMPTSPAWWLRRSTIVDIKPRPQRFMATYETAPTFDFPTEAPPVMFPQRTALQEEAWVLIAWATISTGLLGWMLVRWIQVVRSVRRANPELKSLKELFEEARRASGLKRDARLRVTDHAISPAVCGLFRPTILIPRLLATQLTPAQLRAVLLHELIHLKRGDVWVNCAQTLLQIVYWWHPLLWLANARIRRVREEAVDDAVMLALREEADNYAPTLLEVAKFAFRRPLASLGLVGILESRNALRQRIERLVHFTAPRRAGFSIVSMLGILFFSAVAVPMGAPPPTIVSAVTSDASTEINTNDTSVLELGVTESGAYLVGTNSLDLGALRNLLVVAKILANDGGTSLGLRITAPSQTPVLALTSLLKTCNEMGITNISLNSATNSADPVSSNASPQLAPPTSIQPGVGMGPSNFTQSILARFGSARFERNRDSTFGPPDVSPHIRTVLPSSLHARVVLPTKEAQATIHSAAINDSQILTNDRPYLFGGPGTSRNVVASSANLETIMKQLDGIRLEKLQFEEIPLVKVVQFLDEETKRIDPEKQGIHFSLNPKQLGNPSSNQDMIDPTSGLPIADSLPVDLGQVTIRINPAILNLGLADALDVIVAVADHPITFDVTDNGIEFSLKSPEDSPMFVRRFDKVTPAIIDLNLATHSSVNKITDRSKSVQIPARTPEDLAQSAARLWMATFGVRFDQESGRCFYWNVQESQLLVRATQDDIDMIHAEIEAESRKHRATSNELDARTQPTAISNSAATELTNSLAKEKQRARKQINIKVRFVELPSADGHALGFEWYLGNFLQAPSSSTNRGQPSATAGGALPGSTGIPSELPMQIKMDPPLREGTLTGTLTVPQMKVVIHALAHGSGVQILAEGNFTTLTGGQAHFEESDIKTIVSGIDPRALVAPGIQSSSIPYLTANLSVGTAVDVVAANGPDDDSIHLTITAGLTEFLGYDQPTNTASVYIDGKRQPAVMPLPNIHKDKIAADAILRDGQTMVLGGLVSEAVTNISNKIPVLGDVSLMGRLFRSHSTQIQKKQVILFVTPTLIDAAGNRIHK